MSVLSIIKYNGLIISDTVENTDYVDILYKGNQIQSFTSGDKVILKTADNYFSDNIRIGTKVINSKNKIIKENIECFGEELGSLKFWSPNSFSIGCYSYGSSKFIKGWDGTMEYSTDTITWNIWDGTGKIQSAHNLSDNKYYLYIRGTNNTYVNTSSSVGDNRWILCYPENIKPCPDMHCTGNIETLLDYNTVLAGNHPTMGSRAFGNMFKNSYLVEAPILSATTLADHCYDSMFWSCKSLIVAPALPVTTLADYCYSYMFAYCTSLTTTPELPATTLVSGCYCGMFEYCKSLTTTPILPATTLASGCYSSMFEKCSSLTTVPVLPATTLVSGCYSEMFNECTSLTTAPELPATTLADYCYSNMFKSCTALTTAPELPATTLADYCYDCMFYNCTALTTALELPATTLAEYCYQYMFSNCTALTTAPELPATTMVHHCYYNMFNRCTSLTTAPELPATILANNCYDCMFSNCTALITVPALPATTLAEYCYRSMFYNCTSLTTVPALPATTLPVDCYFCMFQECTSLIVSDTSGSGYDKEWRIPTSGIIEYAPTGGSGDGMFINCAGTREGDNLIIEIGQFETYYTQNTPIS